MRANGVDLAYDRAGEGGRALLLLHGWPETRRIWRRNVEPLAEAGFDVIAPDLRGFGDSGAGARRPLRRRRPRHRHGRALAALGHERAMVCAGDLGGVVAQDLSLRFEGLVERLVLFNTIPPVLPGHGAGAGARGAHGRRLLRQAGA